MCPCGMRPCEMCPCEMCPHEMCTCTSEGFTPNRDMLSLGAWVDGVGMGLEILPSPPSCVGLGWGGDLGKLDAFYM